MALFQGKPDPSKLSYLSVAAYNNDIFTYSTGLNAQYVETGSLGPVSGATAVTCQKGRVLRENGRKLWPSANPGITTYLVGVYDAISGISGFIDPNSPVYTLFSSNKVYSLDQSVDPGPGAMLDKGMPILTNSSVEAGTFVSAGTNVSAGIDVNAGRDVRAVRDVNAGRNVNAVGNVDVSGNVNVLVGRLVMNTGNTGNANMGDPSAVVVGTSFKKLTVSASNCRTTSRVFLTYSGQANPGALSAEVIANGSFQIVSSSITDVGTVQWLVVN
jgi:hypothetical protein